MTDVVRAGGGLVWRRTEDGELEVVVVHRSAYDDWTFPKGKARRGESDEEAAVREVEEETGLRCRLVRDLGTTDYRDARGRAKSVHYWEMTVVEGSLEPAHEIDAARWCGVSQARPLLTYERDRQLLDRFGERA